MLRIDWSLRRVYVLNRRLHHAPVGIALCLLGAAMWWHDRKDFPWSFIPDPPDDRS